MLGILQKRRIKQKQQQMICCNQPDSVAMKALSKLGVDALEIRQGLKNRLEEFRI